MSYAAPVSSPGGGRGFLHTAVGNWLVEPRQQRSSRTEDTSLNELDPEFRHLLHKVNMLVVVHFPPFASQCDATLSPGHERRGFRNMSGFIQSLLDYSTYSPHGICLLWQPGLIWLHVFSDAIIAISYFSIPFALSIFVAKRPDVEFG
jgi:hypothetical protein